MQKNFCDFYINQDIHKVLQKITDIRPYKLLFFSKEFAPNLLLLNKKIPALNRDNY